MTGIGFIGAGAILRHGLFVRGLTTAASLCVAAGIGLAAGMGYYSAALATTVIVVTLWPLRALSQWLFARYHAEEAELVVELRDGEAARDVVREVERLGGSVASVDVAQRNGTRTPEIGAEFGHGDRDSAIARLSERERVVGAGSMRRPESTTSGTACCHVGREDLTALGVHAPPLDLSSTYPLHDLDAAEAAFEAFERGEVAAEEPIYARLHNPTVGRFERALAQLEGTEAAVAFGSGMAALTACLLAARSDGEHVAALRPLYGGTDGLLASGLLGLDVSWARPGVLRPPLRPDTSLVLLETPQNPTLGLVDIAAVVEAAAGVPVLVDNTFATPVLQNPARQGAALVVHSATKYLGGHGDVVGGVVATSEAWARRLRRVRILTGALMHPLAAYLLLRGLPTLPMRVAAAQERAGVLAARLADHPAVTRVFYPALPRADPRGLVGGQMAGPGAMLAFEVAGGHDAAARVMRALRIVTPAVSLGSTDSLIEHPAGLTHRVVDPEARLAAGITPGLLRLSVGLEDAEDLWADLDRALATAERRLAAAT